MMLCLLASALLGLPDSVDLTGSATLLNGHGAKWAVVWLEGKEKAVPLDHYVIDQKNRAFNPHISVVPVGTKVEFPNHDTVLHNVFADFDAKRFDLGFYTSDKTPTMKFDRPGMVAMYCQIHEEMNAFIVVVDTPYYTKADESGNFRLRGVPTGSYTLHVWHENRQVFDAKIEVKANMPSLALHLVRGKI